MPDKTNREHADPSARPRSPHRGEHLEHERASQPAAQEKPPYSSSLLADPRLHMRGNHPVQIAAMQRMQQTHGNRAVRRTLQRTAHAPTRQLQASQVGMGVQRWPFSWGMGGKAGTSTGAAPTVEKKKQPVKGTEVMKFGLVAKVDPHLSLWADPDQTGPALAQLKFNDRIFVRTEVPGDLYYVVTRDGKQGYIWKKKVFLNPPEPNATLHQVEAGQYAYAVARKFYSNDIQDDADLRFYVNALVHVNGGVGNPNKGIYRKADDDEDWEETKTTAGKYIWIPSARYALTLRGIVKKGSRKETVKGWFQAGAEWITEFAKGLLEGGKQSLLSLFSIELAEKIWELMQSDFSDIAVAIYEWVTELTWEKVENFFGGLADRFNEFEAKWNNKNVFKAARFQGHVIGFVLMDFVVGAVAGAALKMASRLPGVALRAVEGLAESRRLVTVAKELGIARKIETAANEARLAQAAAKKLEKEAAEAAAKKLEKEAAEAAAKQGAKATTPTHKPDPSRTPGGKATKIEAGDDVSTVRSLTKENESAQKLAKGGYDVVQNPKVPGGKNPDYLIEGRVFDNYAPSTSKVRNIYSEIKTAKVDSGQATRIVLNLDDSPVTIEALTKQFKDWPMSGLDEIIIVRGDKVIPFFPF